MKHRLTWVTILLLISTAFITGCNKPPPITDSESFIANLRYTGATVNTTRTESNATSFAEFYVNFYYEAIEGVQDSGKVIEPEFLEAEMNRLSGIQERADDIEITRTEITLNGAKVQVLEYDSEESAAWDAAYITSAEDFDLTVPTDKGDVDIVISPLGIELYAYIKSRIIVEYYSVESSDESVLSLLESILGPPFYDY